MHVLKIDSERQMKGGNYMNWLNRPLFPYSMRYLFGTRWSCTHTTQNRSSCKTCDCILQLPLRPPRPGPKKAVLSALWTFVFVGARRAPLASPALSRWPRALPELQTPFPHDATPWPGVAARLPFHCRLLIDDAAFDQHREEGSPDPATWEKSWGVVGDPGVGSRGAMAPRRPGITRERTMGRQSPGVRQAAAPAKDDKVPLNHCTPQRSLTVQRLF